MKEKFKYLITGGLAGLANGFFGSGGGLFLIPLMTRWAKLDERRAFASSIAVILPLSVVSAAICFMQRGMGLWEIFSEHWGIFLGGFSGGLISGKIFKKVSLIWLKRSFGLLIVYGGIRAVLGL